MHGLNRILVVCGALLVVVLLLIFISSDQLPPNLAPNPPEEISIFWSDMVQAVGLEIGSVLEVVLPYDPSSGCQWETGFYNPAVLEPYGELEISDPVSGIDAPQTQWMHFLAIGEGETELALLLGQSGQNCDMEPGVFTVKVFVR